MSRVRNTCIKFRKSRSNNTKCCFKNIVQITHVRFKLLQFMVSQATLYIICFPRIVLVTYVNVDIHSICLIMTLSCLKSLLLCALYTNLSHLITNLFLYVLFCVFPVRYDVRLSHEGACTTADMNREPNRYHQLLFNQSVFFSQVAFTLAGKLRQE